MNNNKMSRSTKIVIAIVIACVLIASVAFKLVKNKREVEAKVYLPDVNTAVAVQVDTVKSGRFDLTTTFTGSFSPNREVVIGSETSGKVIKVNVEEGSHVSTGQLIAQLDDRLTQAQLQSAQANHDKAVNTLARYQQGSSGVTQLQMDNAKTEILTTQAQIEQLKTQIRQFTISAPFGGIITSRNFELGAIVSPGVQMATLTDISSVKLEISVPERNIAQFSLGQMIYVKTDVYPDAPFRGKVDMIGSKADASHNFQVKILIPNPKSALKSGMYGTVVFNSEASADALTIPRSALLGSSVKPQVYVVEAGVSKLRDIQTGGGNETRIQVTSGLHKNEVVVSGGLVNLSDGTKVSTAN
jgi:RND family efflux transporter MFP subunit